MVLPPIQPCYACELTWNVTLATGLAQYVEDPKELAELQKAQAEEAQKRILRFAIDASTFAVQNSEHCGDVFKGSNYSVAQLLNHFAHGTSLPGPVQLGRIGSISYQKPPAGAANFTGDKATWDGTRFGKGTIVVDPGQVTTIGATVLAETLLHELAHAINYTRGLGDTLLVYDANPDGSPNDALEFINSQLLLPCGGAINQFMNDHAKEYFQ